MELPVNKIINKDWIEAAKTLPDGFVHTIITSPPYWGQRNYGVDGQLGLEPNPDLHIEKLVAGFRELRRVLRDDGTLWVNYGDKYAGSGGENDNFSKGIKKGTVNSQKTNLDSGNLLGLAWRLALALQSDGWILRSDIIWAKGLSFCESYSGSVMPESVNGWRWEKCRVKIKSGKYKSGQANITSAPQLQNECYRPENQAQYQDCPGCSKCEPNGGYVLRKGSWRPTKGHEYLFQFAKQQGYFCDMDSVREKGSGVGGGSCFGSQDEGAKQAGAQSRRYDRPEYGNRNLRDVWVINPQPWGRAHYATFPEKLVEPIIKVATSQKGCCPKCGSPWCRVIDSRQIKRERPNDKTDRHNQGEGVNSCGNTVAGVESTTLGWRATCDCNAGEPIPSIVYDPFMGSGTVAAVATRLGRNYCGSELSKDYLDNQAVLRIAESETGISMAEQETGQGALFQ
jgi:site-specific DNA-methyltransferase (adenine-specific)